MLYLSNAPLNMFIMFEQALNTFFPIFSFLVYLNMLKPYRPKKLKNEMVEIQ